MTMEEVVGLIDADEGPQISAALTSREFQTETVPERTDY